MRSTAITAVLRRASSHQPVADGSGTVAIYLRRARLIDSLRLHLHSPSPTFPQIDDPFVAVAVLRAAPSPDSALSLFRSLSSPHPAALLALSRRLSLARRLPDLHSLLSTSPHPLSPLDRLRLLAAAGDLSSSLPLFASLRSASASSHRGHPCTESYNLIMSLHVSTSDADAVATFRQLKDDGAIPNSRTYTIVISHLLQSSHLDSALKVFDLLPFMRVRRTSKQFNLLADALASTDRIDDLRQLITDMHSDGILPGPAMHSAILKLRSAGFTEETDDFELSPDKRIGYAEDSASDTDGDEHTGHVKLKPWIDPAALARALDGWDAEDVSALEAAGFVWTPRLVCKLLRGFRRPETAWEFFCWVVYQPGGFEHDRHTVSRMIAILAQTGHVELVDRLLYKVAAEGIQLPFATVRLVIDLYGLSKKADPAVKVFREADTICGVIGKSARMLLYSSLLRTVLKCGKGDVGMELLEEMMMEGVLPDAQTFSGLMEYFAGEGDLKTVHKLFGMTRQAGVEPDGFMYQVLIQAYCKHGRSVLAMRVFEEMRGSGLMPDRRAKALLVKSLWKEGKLREAASVEERCEEMETELRTAAPGHVWTVSYGDFKRVYDIYSGCFAKSDAKY